MKTTLSIFSGLLLAFSMSAQTTTTTFNYSGAIQTFTVPACVTSMTIEARGAQGGYNTSSGVQSGLGAVMIGTFTVTPGQVLKILVGEQPSLTTGTGNGGGGGTFVTDNSNNPLIVAGGGGGSAGSTDSPAKHGNITTTGGTGAAGGGAGGTAGSGGGVGSSGFQSGAGGGLLTNGADGWAASTGGAAFVNGGAGGPTNAPARGGFGGGGSGSSYVVGGGGGGYSGGGSGGNSSAGVGGGGGSYNAGTNQTNTGGINTGHGMVTLTYTLGPSVTPSISGVNMACDGDTITLTSSTVPGAISYNWTVPGTATIVSGQTTTSIVLAVGNASGTVSVTATDACGTTAPGTLSYTVNPLPTLSVTATSTVVCENSQVTMTASGATNYVWSSGGNAAMETVTVTSNNTYTVTGTDANGCSSSATQMIMMNMNPVVYLGPDTNVCGSTMLDAQIAGATYAWSEGSTTQTINVTSSGTYSLILTDGNGCLAYDTINVGVGGNFTTVGSAAMNFVCTGEPTVALTGSPAGGVWSGAGVFGNTFEPDSAGVGMHNLIYTYSDSLGCSGTDTVMVNVDLCLGLFAQNDNGGINVYPNPNNGAFAISFAKSASDVVVEISDVQGRIVYTSNESTVNAGSVKQIDLSNQADGLYMLRVVSGEDVNTMRIILQR